MEIIERTRTLAVRADEVWAMLSDFGAISGWASNVDHSCVLTDQPDGVGAVRRIQTGRTTPRETVQTWQTPTTLGYRISGLPPVVRSLTNTWHLAANGDRTRIMLRTETAPLRIQVPAHVAANVEGLVVPGRWSPVS